MSNKKTEFLLEKLASTLGYSLDKGDSRMFEDNFHCNVFAHLMNKKQYDQMCKEINDFSIEGEGFSVHTWNDVSGYKYWKNQGKSGDSNYIKIEINFTEKLLAKVDPKKVRAAVEQAVSKFSHYNNFEEYQNYKEYLKENELA